MRRFWERWIWSGERRRHGAAVRRVLAGWRPAGERSKIPAAEDVADSEAWRRDEDLLTAILAMLWQGASERDLARWLAEQPEGPGAAGLAEEEIARLAAELVEAYEREIFSDG